MSCSCPTCRTPRPASSRSSPCASNCATTACRTPERGPAPFPKSAILPSRLSGTLAAFLIAVDVGHYHAEPGARSASGRAEFEFNLLLALELKGALENSGLRVRMIGERGDYALLRDRPRDAAGADLFVSIHHDSVKPELLADAALYSGFSIFVSRENPEPEKSLACASAIGERLRAAGFAASRYHADPVLGESRPFADENNGVHFFDQLAVLRAATMPALLVEAGVIVNPDEELRLRSPEVRRSIAEAIAAGARQCLAQR